MYFTAKVKSCLRKIPQAENFYNATQVYKPGSVLTAIYLVLRSLAGSSHLLEAVGQTYMLLHGVAPDRVYSTPVFPRGGCALTTPFHPYPRRFTHINVHFTASSKAHRICEISVIPSNPLALGFDGGPVGDEAVSLCCTCPEVTLGRRYLLSLPCGARTFLT